MPSLTVNLLGPVEVLVDGLAIASFRTARARALLFYLVLEPPQTFQREALMALLWPDAPLKAAQASLRQAIYQINQAIPRLDSVQHAPPVPLLETARYTLGRSPDAALLVDAAEFRSALAKVRRHGHNLLQSCPGCRQELEAAAALYRGPLLDNFFLHDSAPFEEWARRWRAELAYQALEALQRLTDIYLRDEQWIKAAALARRQLELDPFAERGLRQLLTAEAHQGRRSQALVHYEAYRARLAAELQTTPDTATASLAERLRAGKTILSLPRTAAAPADTTPRLPPLNAYFVGRTRELDALQQMIAGGRTRLITITGPGGMGKTSLAHAVAHNVREAFPDGAVAVPIPPDTTGQTMLRLLAEYLALPQPVQQEDTPALLSRLQGHLRSRRLLLLLDSFEMAEGCEPLLEGLLSTAPGLVLLLTSRVVLRPPMGQVFPLQGLDVPPAGTNALDVHRYAAPRLLRHAALRTNPQITWDLDAWAAAAKISRLLSGMPLALELAAAWTHALPMDVIADEIHRGIDILTTDAASLPPRHRSVTAVLDASWQQLTPEERRFCNLLSLFHDGFTREAAAAVAGPGLSRTQLLRRLAGLLEKSLLSYDLADDRYQFHDLLHQYAAQQLTHTPEEESAARRRHATYFLPWLAAQEERIRVGQPRAERRNIQRDLSNVDQAWRWAAAAGEWELLSAALPALATFCTRQSDPETGLHLLRALLSRIDAAARRRDPLAARLACRTQAHFTQLALLLGQREPAGEQLAAGQALLTTTVLAQEDTREEQALLHLAAAAFHQSIDRPHALVEAEKAVTLFRDLSRDLDVADAVDILGRIHHALHQLAAAEAAFTEAIQLRAAHGDQSGLANVLIWQGMNATRSGQFARARELVKRAVDLRRGLGDTIGHAQALCTLGVVEFWSGNHELACDQLQRSYTILRDSGLSVDLAYTLAFLAVAELFCGRYESAAARAEQALTLGGPISAWRDLGIARWVLGAIATMNDDIDSAADHLETALTLFRRVAATTESSFALASLSHVRLVQGRVAEAHSLMRETVGLRGYAGTVFALRGWAAMAQFSGQDELLLLLAGQMSLHGLTNSHFDEDLFRDGLAAAQRLLGSDRAKTLHARGRAMSLDTVVDHAVALLDADPPA